MRTDDALSCPITPAQSELPPAFAQPVGAIGYATPGVTPLPIPMGRRVLRFVLWSVYFLGWAGAGAIGGFIGLGLLGERMFRDGLGPFRNDDFWGLGAVLGPLLALLFAWMVRRMRWLHLLIAMVAVLGIAAACVITFKIATAQPRAWLWEIGVVFTAFWGSGFLALLLAACAGFCLRWPNVGMSSPLMADETKRLYSDVVAAGGLESALQVALKEIGSDLQVSKLDKGINFVMYARVESGSRSSQVYIAAKTRLFIFDCWNRGVMLAQGSVSSLNDLARAIDRWIGTDCTVEILATEFKFVVLEVDAGAYERGEEVEHRWQSYLLNMGERFPELVEFVRAAAVRPQLRQLFPFTSLNRFCFSRCTGYPFTQDTPYVRPLPDGEYAVVCPNGRPLGKGNAEMAADLVARHLPAGCGPAVAGTANDLEETTSPS